MNKLTKSYAVSKCLKGLEIMVLWSAKKGTSQFVEVELVPKAGCKNGWLKGCTLKSSESLEEVYPLKEDLRVKSF